MSELEKMCNEYRANKRLIEELTAMNDSLKASIIALMGDSERLCVGSTKISNVTVSSLKIDSNRLKAEMPEVYQQFSRESVYKRFTIQWEGSAESMEKSLTYAEICDILSAEVERVSDRKNEYIRRNGVDEYVGRFDTEIAALLKLLYIFKERMG